MQSVRSRLQFCLRGDSHDQTPYCPYCSSQSCELDSWAAYAGCDAAADYDSASYHRDSTADDQFYAYSAGSGESNDDAAN